jgi:hypothetical protein
MYEPPALYSPYELPVSQQAKSMDRCSAGSAFQKRLMIARQPVISSSLLTCHETTILAECQRPASAAPSHAAGELAGRTNQHASAWFGVRLQAFVGILMIFPENPTLSITWSKKQAGKPTDSSLWTILKLICLREYNQLFADQEIGSHYRPYRILYQHILSV